MSNALETGHYEINAYEKLQAGTIASTTVFQMLGRSRQSATPSRPRSATSGGTSASRAGG
jgi:hypothetical protein